LKLALTGSPDDDLVPHYIFYAEKLGERFRGFPVFQKWLWVEPEPFFCYDNFA